MRVRPLSDFVLVEMEPLPQQVGSIILPADNTVARIRFGRVIDVGPGRWFKKTNARVPTDLNPGDRVAFYRENLEHQQGKQVQGHMAEIGDNIGLIRVPDVLFVVEAGTKVEALS